MSETDSTATEDSNKLSGKKQIKFELCGSGPGYVGGGIRRSLHGIIYQLNLLMLFMKRGLEQGYNFHLATEVDAAGKFDDVVFQYKDNEGNTKHRFLQAKHKQNYERKLNKSDLLNQTRDDYSVQKYFMSYFNIKTNKPKLFQGEYQDFIICTNIDIDDDIIDEFDAIQYPDPLLEFDKEKCASPPKRLKFKKGTNLYEELEEILLKNANYYLIAEKLGTMMAKIRNDRNKVITIEKIFTDHKDWIMEHIFDTSTEKMNGNKHCFKLRDDFLNPIDQDKVNLNEIFLNAYAKEENEESKLDNIKTVLALTQYQLARSFLKSKPKTKVVSHQQQEIDTFLNKLVLAVNQPTEDEIKDIAQEEIGNYMKLIDSELVANKLQVCILDWAKRRHGYFITSEDCKDFFRDVENQLMCFWQTGLTLMRKSKIENLECLFDENETIQAINNFLVGTENNQLLLLYYDNPLLTEAKLMQLKQNARSDEFIFCDMEVLLKQVDDTVCPLKAFQSRASDQLFIMFSNNSDVNSEVKLLIHRLFNVLVSREEKQIILIMPFIIKDQFESLTKYLIGDIRYAKVFDVNNNFGDLCIESQEKLLKEAILTFKGCKVKLGELDADDLKRSISGDILSQLVCRELQIKDLNKDDQYGEVAEYYITRSLCRTISISPEVISQNQFQIKYDDDVKSVEPNQDVILVSDSKIVFESLCQSNKNDIHWLKHKNGQLIWQESRGSLSKLQKYVVTGGNKTEDETSELFEQYHPLVGSVDWTDSGSLLKEMRGKYFPPLFGEDQMSIASDQNIVVNNVMDVKDKIVLIAADPGMGKSTMLSHVALQSTNQIGCHHDLCIIKVNLRDYYDDFDAWSDKPFTPDEVIEFLFKVSNFEHYYGHLKTKKNIIIQNDGQLHIHFEKDYNVDSMCVLTTRLFTHLYNNRKIVILLDGFDEVAPKYTNKGFYLLEALRYTRVHQIWLTTRISGIETDLENKLNTFCYKIVPFNIDDQKSFLIHYWESKLKTRIDERSFEKFFSKFVKPTFQNLNTAGSIDQSSFMGIPLHVMMIATVYEDKIKNLSEYTADLKEINIEKLTAYDLYDRFFKIKFKILYKEINFKDPKYYDDYEEKLRHLMTRHEKFALIEMFGHEDIPEELVPETDEEIEDLLKLVTSVKEKTGLVTRVVDGRPHFVHRTFAEFFAANLLANALLLKNTRRERKYHAASDFLYRLLTGPTCIRSVMTFLNYKVVSISDHVSIFNAAISLDLKVFNQMEYFYLRDCLGRTPVHLMFCSGKYTWKKCGKEHNQLTSQEQINSLYEVDALFKWTPWHYAIACHDCRSIELHFWNNVTKNNINLDLKDNNGVTPYILAAKRGCSNNCIRAYLQDLPVDINAKDNAGMTAMHYALNRTDRKGELFACMLITIGADISIPDSKGITPFDIIMSQNLTLILRPLIKNLLMRNNYDLIKVLCEKLSSDKDFCVFVLSQTMELTQLVLENVAIDVNVQDAEGKTALHHAFQRLHLDGTDTIACLIKNNANVYQIDNDGKLPSHFNYEAAMKIFTKGHSPRQFSFLNEIVGNNINLMKQFILSMNIDDAIVVHILSRYIAMSKILLEDNKISVNQIDSEGKTALHYAVMFQRPKNVVFLLRNHANPVVRDKYNKTPLEYISKDTKYDEEIDKRLMIIRFLLKYGAYFDVDADTYEYSELIKSAHNLVDAVKSENVEEVDSILRSSKDPQVVVNSKSKDNGRRAIHYAALGGNEIITEILLSYGAIYNAPDDESAEPDTLTSNQNIVRCLNASELLLLSIQNRNIENVVKYIKAGVTVNAGYMHGSMANMFYPLHMAIQTGNVDFVEILMNHGAKVSMRTGFDENALHVVASTTCVQSDYILKSLIEPLTLKELFEVTFGDFNETIQTHTPLILMILTENFTCLKMLLDKCTFYEHKDEFDGKKILDAIRDAKMYIRDSDIKEIIEEILNEFSVKCDEVWNPLHKLLEQININFPDFLFDEDDDK